MQSLSYNFLMLQWINGKVSAETLQAFVPKFITQDECDTILATPQGAK